MRADARAPDDDVDDLFSSTGPDGIGVVFPPTALGVRRALAIVTESLRDVAIPTADLQTLELVLAEAMNNVVEHAYVDAQDGDIELRVNGIGRALHCVISDGGLPMPQGRAPEGPEPIPGLPLADQQEGGFGWYLIRELSTDLVYVRSKNRNQLTFLVPLSGTVEPG